jgi:hypothetical protein
MATGRGGVGGVLSFPAWSLNFRPCPGPEIKFGVKTISVPVPRKFPNPTYKMAGTYTYNNVELVSPFNIIIMAGTYTYKMVHINRPHQPHKLSHRWCVVLSGYSTYGEGRLLGLRGSRNLAFASTIVLWHLVIVIASTIVLRQQKKQWMFLNPHSQQRNKRNSKEYT